ncbi:hypothetical protein F5Y16DRAFT_227039 [Xylariaceae sp. FL0255]|nr:hypothetical protein F5Y16DRAFT_227039 [Xylariaceae sp. FL0255]
MSAPGITYEGALAKNQPAGEKSEGVFNNLQVWLSSFVPQRQAYKQKIEENGGRVTMRETQAHILICNEAKQPLPGSYSHMLIDDAVRDGSLDRKEEYRCRSPIVPGPSGPGTKPKLTRNEYTAEEDKQLTKYVEKMFLEGKPLGGNVIFKEFAEENPTHTWQSWLDRWKKKLKPFWTPPNLDAGRSSTEPLEEPSNGSNLPASTKTAKSPKRTAVSQKKTPDTQRKEVFTADEDNILLVTIQRTIANQQPWNALAPYQELAKEYPQHKVQKWRDRALNYVAVENGEWIAQWETESRKQLNADRKKTESRRKAKRHSPTQTDRQGISYIEARNSSPPGSSGENQDARFQEEITLRKQFVNDYNTFLENAGIDSMPTPTIRGTELNLWKLWRAVSVRSKNTEFAELDWQQIAEDLGFDWTRLDSVPEELRECYQQHLAPFVDCMRSFNEDEGDSVNSDDDDDEHGNGVFDDTVTVNEVGSTPVPSSPPQISPKKRAHSASRSPDLAALQPTSKRSRRECTIPSTPDHVNGTLHLRHFRDRVGHGSPSTTHSRREASLELDSEVRDHVLDLPSIPGAQKPNLEPETQDFSYDPETQVNFRYQAPDEGSQMTMTPSQQLQLESDAFSTERIDNDLNLPLSHDEALQATPTPRRTYRTPFAQDDTDDDTFATPKGRSTLKGRHGVLSTKRKVPTPSDPRSTPLNQDDAQNKGENSSFTEPGGSPNRTPAPVNETPQEIVDRFVSLGYHIDIVIRSLKATSWIVGNAGHVMEMLKQGDPLPQMTTGVWTQRDDDALRLVCSVEEPASEKDRKKREREEKRLQAKHGAEQIEHRKWYLLSELPE